MKHKLTFLFVLVALMFAVSATPVFADDDKDGGNPPCEQCDGQLGDI